ncbi:MAG: GIY-YIG nuclease family protein [Proteobacteria bacterium]|nr:GIY-YIG nuclease family protein [Pseudomonadota bacterium]MBU1420445.1 GIY-YIG nuclease family protein [Pseudomonadota bacterium]MBU1456352.1 GIY-YIG nuclease family protein [Pseudomonadota bacterium]
MEKETVPWFVYLLRCSDHTLYTGITTNLEQRFQEHNHSEKGAKYTRGRRPVQLVYHEQQTSRSLAARREHEIKRFSRQQKEQLIKNSSSSV